jgi:hypothetical protein
MPSPLVQVTSRILLFLFFTTSYASAGISLDTGSLLGKMEAAYAEVNDYQPKVEINTYQTDGLTNGK